MSATKIGWTDLTLNPVIGCTHAAYEQPDGKKVAHPGCVNCYAEKMCSRKLPGFEVHNHCSRGGKWTGKIEVIHERLTWPFTRKEYKPRQDGKQRRCFLTSLSDMGHPGLAEADWMAVQGMMLLSHWITWQDLTKRPERQAALLEKYSPLDCVAAFRGMLTAEQSEMLEAHAISLWNAHKGNDWEDFSHIHRYVSVSDQATADALIPELLKMPCAVHGVSLEPMVGAVSLKKWLTPGYLHCGWQTEAETPTCINDCDRCKTCWTALGGIPEPALQHVIVGGESGRGTGIRPFDLAWAESIVEQCKRAGVWCFVKQLGSRPVCDRSEQWKRNDGIIRFAEIRDGRIWPDFGRKGEDIADWPEALCVRQNVGDP